MRLSTVIENLVAEFGNDSDQGKTSEIVSIICKAFKNVNVPDEKAATLIKVGRKLKAIGVR